MSLRKAAVAVVAAVVLSTGVVTWSSTTGALSGQPTSAPTTAPTAGPATAPTSGADGGSRADGELLDYRSAGINKVSRASAAAKVKALQYLLNAWGASPNLKIDGKYGSATTKAVKNFQRKKGLEQDGKAGPITLGKLIVRRVSGDRGKTVRAIQVLLNYQGAAITVDGSFGTGTKAAAKAFQKAAGIEQDGKVGSITWAKLFNRTPGSGGGGGGGTGLGATIASIAQRELGNPDRNVERGGNNCNYYTAFWKTGAGGCGSTGFRSEAWCADFAKYVWHQAGAKVTGLNAWAPNFRDVYGNKHGTNHRWNPKVGDAVTYDWGRDGVIDHVEVVTAVSGNSFTSIGGNTGPNTKHIKQRTLPVGSTSVVTFVSPVA